LGLIELDSVPAIDSKIDITPVDLISRSIVNIAEAMNTVNTTINLSATHTIAFKAVWTEICRQRKVAPYYSSVGEWRQQLHERLNSNPQLSNKLFILDTMIDNFAGDTTANIDVDSNLNLPLFVTALLRSHNIH
jgi:hypothetical protein